MPDRVHGISGPRKTWCGRHTGEVLTTGDFRAVTCKVCYKAWLAYGRDLPAVGYQTTMPPIKEEDLPERSVVWTVGGMPINWYD